MSKKTSPNAVWHLASVTRARRESQNTHKACVLWFTGLSGAGKSTLAHAIEERLHQMQCRTFVFDGDNVRHGLCGDLDFSDKDRVENIRRVGEMSKLFIEAGVIALTAFISPFKEDRRRVRALVGKTDFVEVYCKADLAVCEQRDVKGMYKRARTGEIKDFTGISSPYEEPVQADIVVDTGNDSLDGCIETVLLYLHSSGRLPRDLDESNIRAISATR